VAGSTIVVFFLKVILWVKFVIKKTRIKYLKIFCQMARWRASNNDKGGGGRGLNKTRRPISGRWASTALTVLISGPHTPKLQK